MLQNFIKLGYVRLFKLFTLSAKAEKGRTVAPRFASASHLWKARASYSHVHM